MRFLSLKDGLNEGDLTGEMKYRREEGLEKKIIDVCDVKPQSATTLLRPPKSHGQQRTSRPANFLR